MKISVFGLGYVGAVSSACMARDGHDVLGCDIDDAKLELIRSGESPIVEEGMAELMASSAASGRLRVTSDAAEAIAETDVSFLCVGTPSLPNGGQDLTAIERLCEQLGAAMKDKDEFHVFVVRSTVLPGTVDTVVRPTLERHSGKSSDEAFAVCFQPEFLREGSSIKDYDNPPFTVVGTRSDRAGSMLRDVFGHLPCAYTVTDIANAELLKYCCNIFHALKITFANEVGRVGQHLGVDPHAVMRLVCQDTSLNISPAYMRPGFAFGGSCLPKDLRALLHIAKHGDVEIPMLQGILPSNNHHVERAVDWVLGTKARSVGMIGLSFKSGTDDLRESPLVTLAERFIGKGLDLKIHDPEVQLARLRGANKRYIEEAIPHIGRLLTAEVDEVVTQSEVVIVGLTDPDLLDAVYRGTKPEQWVLDLVNMRGKDRVRARYHGVCW